MGRGLQGGEEEEKEEEVVDAAVDNQSSQIICAELTWWCACRGCTHPLDLSFPLNPHHPPNFSSPSPHHSRLLGPHADSACCSWRP